MKKAIFSVSDKSDLLNFARVLAGRFEILSTSGTYRLLKEGGVPVQKIEDFTGVPELLGGKVKTLHPKIFAGILGNDPDSVGLVAVNLYPVGKGEIDIGGSALLRAAAKNYENVIVLCDPADYEEAARRIAAGDADLEFRKTLAAKAFRLTASYDAEIAASLDSGIFPERLTLSYRKAGQLAYGENPYTEAALYLKEGAIGATQLQGRPLSYNNLLDADSALTLAMKFERPACAIIKHNNPCGMAVKESLAQAFIDAYEADSLCAFGGVVAFNGRVDLETAEAMGKKFFDLAIAPDFSEEAIECLQRKSNLRVLKSGLSSPRKSAIREIAGGLLVQTEESFPIQKGEWKVVTEKQPTEEEIEDLLFAAKVNEEVKSNSTVIAKNGVAIGVGAGQMSRIDSVQLAIGKAKDKAKDAVMSSDGFFPFPDSIEAAAEAGITAIIQPGGSKKDQDAIDACNRNGIAMVFTGKRLFKH